MSDTQLVVLSMASEESARDLVRQLEAIDELDANVTIVDAALAIKNRRGKAKLKQLKVAGSSRGGVAGAISGAFAGLASIFRDAGIDDDMMRRTAEDLSAGEVALFLLYTGHWDRSSAVLRDALAAHGIHYSDGRRSSSYAAPPPPVPLDSDVDSSVETEHVAGTVVDESEPIFDDEPVFDEVSVFEDESDLGAPSQAVVESDVELPEQVMQDVPAQLDEEAGVVVDSGPASGDESIAPSVDPVADAARSALIAGAIGAAASTDPAIEEQVESLSEIAGAAGAADTREAEEILDSSARVGDEGTRIALLSLERKYSGLEIGRIAGELAQIGREVGERDMPLLSAILANRSGVLQRIASETISSAATARELASVLDSAGGVLGELGAAELDEGAARLAVASALAAQAADLGADQLTDAGEP